MKALLRAVIRLIDASLRRACGIFEFSHDVECLLRLQVKKAPHALRLGAQVVEAGEPVLLLHFWSEHIPPLPSTGPDLAWALRFQRLLIRSGHAVGRYMRRDPRLAAVRAVGGSTVLISPREHPGGARLMERLGFTVVPPHGLPGCVEWLENLYAWLLMWTFNIVSLRSRRFARLYRTEVWMTVDDFLSRYGVSETRTI